MHSPPFPPSHTTPTAHLKPISPFVDPTPPHTHTQALAAQAEALEDYLAAGGDEGAEEATMDTPVDPYADIDPELLGGKIPRLLHGWE